MKLKTLFLPFLFLAFISCSNDDDEVVNCTDRTMLTTSLESEYNCSNTKNDLEVALSNDFIVIRDQAGFNINVTGNCTPEINFGAFDLVIGKQGLSTGNDSIDYELTEDCITGNYFLVVTFNQNEATVAPNLTYHRLIPKMGPGTELTVTIEIH